jgi:Flp pilus assembly CpaE family ATPase
MTQILTAVGSMWESSVATLLGGSREVQISRRCADLADLLAVAGAGLGEVALVSADLRGLDLSAVTDLHRHGLRVVGLTIQGTEAEERWLRSVGIDALVPVHAGLVELEVQLLAHADGGGPVPDLLFDLVGEDLQTGERAGGDEPGEVLGALSVEASSGRILAVWGPIGAPGRTTLAVNIAAEAAAAGRSTLLVDLDTYGGCVAQVLSLLDEAPGIAAACRAAEQGGLDVASLARLSPTVMPQLRVLTGVPKPERWTEVRAGSVERVLELSRRLAEVVVLDCGFCIEDDEELSYDTLAPRRNASTLTALALADDLLVVGAADPVGLQRLVRALQELDQVTAPTPRIVLNKVRASAVGPRPRAALADSLSRFAGVSELSFVPDDRDSLDAALLTGRTLGEAAPLSPARAAIAELARLLVGIPAPARRRARRGTMGA